MESCRLIWWWFWTYFVVNTLDTRLCIHIVIAWIIPWLLVQILMRIILQYYWQISHQEYKYLETTCRWLLANLITLLVLWRPATRRTSLCHGLSMVKSFQESSKLRRMMANLPLLYRYWIMISRLGMKTTSLSVMLLLPVLLQSSRQRLLTCIVSCVFHSYGVENSMTSTVSYIYIYIYMNVCMHSGVCVHVVTCVHSLICMHVYMYICVCVYVFMCRCLDVYVCLYVCVIWMILLRARTSNLKLIRISWEPWVNQFR